MDFLDNLVLPQSAHHMVLMKYLLTLTYIIFIPYLCALIGTTIYSVYFKRKAKLTSDPNSHKFAKELVDIAAFNRVGSLGLGIIPLLSAVFCYAQLLHNSGLSLTGYLLLATLFFITGLFFLYSYKSSFHLRDIFNAISGSELKDGSVEEDINNYKARTGFVLERAGKYALLLFLISGYIFIGSIQLAADSSRWADTTSILDLIFSLKSFVAFLSLVTIALAVTPAITLYYNFRPNSEIEYSDEYKQYVKNFSLKFGLIFSLLLPLVVALNVLVTASNALSYGMFAMILFIFFVIILLTNFFYFMKKENNSKYSTSVIFLFIVLFTSVVIKDQLAFDTSTQLQFDSLSAQYDTYRTNMLAELGISVETISGADIYNGRCIACHNFDKRVVGPPYNTVLPKYEGKREQLIQFILNPIKVNPEYTAMPNQGLKPKEAEAVAEYLIKTYEENYK